MDPDFGLGIGREGAGDAPQRPRPTLFVRAMEMVGLALVIYGLGDYRFGLVVLGAVMIFGSYALYRRKHGALPPQGAGDGFGGSDSDGGGD